MQPPSLTKLSLDALGDVPEWFQQLLTPLNEFLNQATTGLGGKLTLSENLQSAVTPLTFQTKLDGSGNFSITVNNPLVGSPTKVDVALFHAVNATQTAAWNYSSVVAANNTVTLTFHGLLDATKYSCNVIFQQ